MAIQKRKAKSRREAFAAWDRRKQTELDARFRGENGEEDPAKVSAYLEELLRRWNPAARPKKRAKEARPPVPPRRLPTNGVRHIYLVGVSCVGKTAIGTQLARNLGVQFISFDSELERIGGKPISRLKAPFLTEYSFRAEVAAPILRQVIEANKNASYVVELPPSGVKDAYWRILKQQDHAIIVAVCDRSTNILKRITFYDDDSNPIKIKLTKKQERLYLKDIQKDVEYFGRTYHRADMRVDLGGAGIAESAKMIEDAIATAGCMTDR